MISMPLIWVGVPLVIGVLLIPLARYRKISTGVVSVLALLLAVLAMIFPANMAVVVLSQRFEFNPTILLLGRLIQVEQTSLTTIALIYFVTLAWNLISLRFKVSQYFSSLSLIITALWVTTFSVEPFLYAAVIVTIIVLVSIPLFSPRGVADQPGLFRYLILQTLAMPLILLSGWMLSGIGSAPSTSPLIVKATLLVILGFALWLAVFPLHSWLPMVSLESHPWVTGLLLSSRQLVLLVYFLYFLDRFAWLRNVPNLFTGIQIIGLIMIAVGGVSAASQRCFKRLFGYFYLVETGYSLLAIGLAHSGGLDYFSLLFVPRFLCYWLWSYAVSELIENGLPVDASREHLKGLIYRAPFLTSSLFFSLLALTGAPVFALFPVKRMIWMLVGSIDIKWLSFLLIGTTAMIVLILNLFRTFIAPTAQTEQIHEGLFTRIAVSLAILVIIIVGIFPNNFLATWTHILDPFTNLLNALR